MRRLAAPVRIFWISVIASPAKICHPTVILTEVRRTIVVTVSRLEKCWIWIDEARWQIKRTLTSGIIRFFVSLPSAVCLAKYSSIASILFDAYREVEGNTRNKKNKLCNEREGASWQFYSFPFCKKLHRLKYDRSNFYLRIFTCKFLLPNEWYLVKIMLPDIFESTQRLVCNRWLNK